MEYIAPVADPTASEPDVRATAAKAAELIRRRTVRDAEALADHPDGRAAAERLADALKRLTDALHLPPHPDPAERPE